MPKRVSLKDSEVFYFKYKIGKTNNKVVYTELKKAEGQFTYFSSTRRANFYGTEFEYNVTLVLEYNETTKYFDEFTKIWHCKPFEIDDTFCSFKINGVSKPVDGLFTVYLKQEISNHNNLWYELDGEIYEIDCMFHIENLTANIPSNMYCKIDYFTKVWYEEPESVETTNCLLKLVYKEEFTNVVFFKFEEIKDNG